MVAVARFTARAAAVVASAPQDSQDSQRAATSTVACAGMGRGDGSSGSGALQWQGSGSGSNPRSTTTTTGRVTSLGPATRGAGLARLLSRCASAQMSVDAPFHHSWLLVLASVVASPSASCCWPGPSTNPVARTARLHPSHRAWRASPCLPPCLPTSPCGSSQDTAADWSAEQIVASPPHQPSRYLDT